MLKFILGVVMLLTSLAASAQTGCVPASLKLHAGEQELSGTVNGVPASLAIVVQPDPKCTAGSKYEVVRGTAYLIRGEQVHLQQVFTGTHVQLSHWMPLANPGDKISVVVDRMYLVTGKDQKKPYAKQLFARLTIK